MRAGIKGPNAFSGTFIRSSIQRRAARFGEDTEYRNCCSHGCQHPFPDVFADLRIVVCSNHSPANIRRLARCMSGAIRLANRLIYCPHIGQAKNSDLVGGKKDGASTPRKGRCPQPYQTEAIVRPA